ncbi:MAG: glycosyltransferase family 2 protein [Paracoccaceae bacterium]|nr:glycosyltransferase family 2 protein [Paracoccaceae bacterium]
MGGYSVITTMKNEAAFLLEWVAHHKALGFDHIVICTNDCADPTVQMALRLQEIGLARHHATRIWPATSIQRAALKQVRRYREVTRAQWLYVCDADEFLVVKLGDGSVRALVDAASPVAEVIAVPWRVFGSAGRRVYEERPVTQQFTRAQAQGDGAMPDPVYPKSLFRGLEAVQRIGIHGPIPRADLGRDLRRELPGGVAWQVLHHKLFAQADYRFAQVKHYALRSRDSFLSIATGAGSITARRAWTSTIGTVSIWPKCLVMRSAAMTGRRRNGFHGCTRMRHWARCIGMPWPGTGTRSPD